MKRVLVLAVFLSLVAGFAVAVEKRAPIQVNQALLNSPQVKKNAIDSKMWETIKTTACMQEARLTEEAYKVLDATNSAFARDPFCCGPAIKDRKICLDKSMAGIDSAQNILKIVTLDINPGAFGTIYGYHLQNCLMNAKLVGVSVDITADVKFSVEMTKCYLGALIESYNRYKDAIAELKK